MNFYWRRNERRLVRGQKVICSEKKNNDPRTQSSVRNPINISRRKHLNRRENCPGEDSNNIKKLQKISLYANLQPLAHPSHIYSHDLFLILRDLRPNIPVRPPRYHRPIHMIPPMLQISSFPINPMIHQPHVLPRIHR